MSQQQLLAQQRQIVDSAIDQLHCAVRAVKTVLQAAAAVQGVDSANESKQVLDAQQAYISHSQEVFRLVKTLQELQPSIAALGEQEQQADSEPDLAALRQRRDTLVEQVSKLSEQEAQLLDQSRTLLDTLSLWEQHKRQLELTSPHGK